MFSIAWIIYWTDKEYYLRRGKNLLYLNLRIVFFCSNMFGCCLIWRQGCHMVVKVRPEIITLYTKRKKKKTKKSNMEGSVFVIAMVCIIPLWSAFIGSYALGRSDVQLSRRLSRLVKRRERIDMILFSAYESLPCRYEMGRNFSIGFWRLYHTTHVSLFCLILVVHRYYDLIVLIGSWLCFLSATFPPRVCMI